MDIGVFFDGLVIIFAGLYHSFGQLIVAGLLLIGVYFYIKAIKAAHDENMDKLIKGSVLDEQKIDQ